MGKVLLVVTGVEGTDIADDITITVGDVIKAEARVVVGDGAEVGTIVEAFVVVAVASADIAVAEVAEAEAATATEAATVIEVVAAVAVVVEAKVVVSLLTDVSEVGG